MNKANNTKEPLSDKLGPAHATALNQWHTPRLTQRGRVSELVQGGGKGGSTSDMDPKNSSKSGLMG